MSTFNIQVTPQNNTLLVIDNDQNQVVVTNPITSVVEVNTLGPPGPPGPPGASFPYTGSAAISGSLVVTGSVTTTQGFTGSLLGTASYALNAENNNVFQYSTIDDQLNDWARDIINGVYGTVNVTGSLLTSASYSNNFQLFEIIQTSRLLAVLDQTGTNITSSLNINDGTELYTGTYFSAPSGSYFTGLTFNVYNPNQEVKLYYTSSQPTIQQNSYFTTSSLRLEKNLVVVEGITGSLFGTASYALTASYAMNGGGGGTVDTGSFVNTSSFNSFTSSINTFTSSYSTGSFTGSFTGSLEGTSSYSNQSLSASYALTASFALNTGTTVDTGSLLTTASVNLNTITFTKGDGSTFPITVNTGSGGGGGGSTFPYTGSAVITGSLTVTGSLIVSGSLQSVIAINGKEFQFKDIGSDALLTTNYSNFRIRANNNNGLYINLNGHVSAPSYMAIGDTYTNTSTPPARLTVKGSGTTSATTALLVQNSNASASLAVFDDGDVGIGILTPSASLHVYNAFDTGTFRTSIFEHRFGVNALSQVARYGVIVKSIDTGNTALGISGQTHNTLIQGFDYSTTAAKGISLNPYGGSVVVGRNLVSTVDDVARFVVRGSGTTSATTALRVENANASSSMVVLDNGNVGIGASTPTELLEIGTTSMFNPKLKIISDGFSTNTGIELTRGGSTFNISNSGNLNIVRGGLNFLTVLSAGGVNIPYGNVGVGTTTPTASLHISGSAGSVLLQVDSNSQQNILYVSGSGRVGVGTNVPSKALTIDANTTDDGLIIRGQTDLPLFQLTKDGTATNSGELFQYGNGSIIFAIRPAVNTSFFNAGIFTFGATTNLGAKVNIRGTGTTSATNALRIENANASASLVVLDNRLVGIGTITPSASLHIVGQTTSFLSSSLLVQNSSGTQVLRVRDDGYTIIGAGDQGIFTNSITVTNWGNFGSGQSEVPSAVLQANSTTKGFLPPRTNLTSNISNPAQGLITYLTGSTNEGLYYYSSGSIKSWTKVLNNTGSQILTTGSLSINTTSTSSALTVYKSGSTVVDIQGSQGQLFSITDSLSGSLFSVSNISGLPILEVFSDDSVVMGSYTTPAMVVTGSSVSVATASAAPTGTATEGTFRFAVVGGAYFIYAYLGGAWRSGSLS